MANFYWIDATGLLGWDDALGWSSTSGGLPNTTAPTTGGNVFWDANSITQPASGPGSPISVNTFDTTGFTFPGFTSLGNLNILVSIKMTGVTAGGSSDFAGTVDPAATGLFIGNSTASANAADPATGTFAALTCRDTAQSASLALVANFEDDTQQLGEITHGNFSDNALNKGAADSADFTDSAVNDTGATIFGLGTFAGSSHNLGTVDVMTMTSATASNASGVCTNKLTVPGTQAGTILTTAVPQSALGTFGSLAISGASAGGGGGPAGPLGGPEFQL